MKDKILLFIPIYNCAPQIIRVLNQVNDKIESIFDEIILIDNNSNDSTTSDAIEHIRSLKLKIKIKVLQNFKNISLGGSHKSAFQYALKNKFDYIAIFHGDDQGKLSDLIVAIETKLYQKLDFFLGSRFLKSSELYGYSKWRIYGNLCFNFIFSKLLNKKIMDLGSGLNIFKVNSLKDKFYINFPNSLTFNYYFTIYICINNYNFSYFPHAWSETDQVSNLKLFKVSKELIALVVKYIIFKQKIFKNLKSNHNKYGVKILYDK